MAIAKKPSDRRTDLTKNQAAEQFIAEAQKPEPEAKSGKQQTTLRMDRSLLARIDAAAKRRGISRSAWITYTLSCALDEEGV
jgi:predicted HicB family RNase H-like nuclease